MSRFTRTNDAGSTLVELAVAAAAAGVAAVVVVSALLGGQKVHNFTIDQSEALTSLQHAGERLTKDLRQARRILPDSTNSKVRFWIDRDRDNIQDASERITWQAVSESGGGVSLQRRTDASANPDRVQAGLASSDLFTYAPNVNATAVVTISLNADVRPDDDGRAARHVKMEVMLRNVAD